MKEKGQRHANVLNHSSMTVLQEHACTVNLPWLGEMKETEREQPGEMSVDQHAAARSLANKRQPLSAPLNEQ